MKMASTAPRAGTTFCEVDKGRRRCREEADNMGWMGRTAGAPTKWAGHCWRRQHAGLALWHAPLAQMHAAEQQASPACA